MRIQVWCHFIYFYKRTFRKHESLLRSAVCEMVDIKKNIKSGITLFQTSFSLVIFIHTAYIILDCWPWYKSIYINVLH